MIDKGSLRVRSGEDLIKQIATYNKASGTYNPLAKGIALARLCSADLAASSAYYDAAAGVFALVGKRRG